MARVSRIAMGGSFKNWRNIKKILKSIGTCSWPEDLAMKAEVLKQAAELSVEAMALGWDGWTNN
jgi:hypothetical protein